MTDSTWYLGTKNLLASKKELTQLLTLRMEVKLDLEVLSPILNNSTKRKEKISGKINQCGIRM
jgi:hypothetical protein